MAAENRVGTKPGVGHGLGHGIPANSQALCVSIVASRIQTNFSRLTYNRECNCLKT